MSHISTQLFILLALLNLFELISSFDRLDSRANRINPTDWYQGHNIPIEQWGSGNRIIEHVIPHMRTITTQYAHNVAIEEEHQISSPRSPVIAHNSASNVQHHLNQNNPTPSQQHQIDLQHPPQHVNYQHASNVNHVPHFAINLRPEQVRYEPTRKRNNNS